MLQVAHLLKKQLCKSDLNLLRLTTVLHSSHFAKELQIDFQRITNRFPIAYSLFMPIKTFLTLNMRLQSEHCTHDAIGQFEKPHDLHDSGHK